MNQMRILKMDELKRKTMEVIDSINNEWVSMLKDAEDKGKGIDLAEMMGKYSNQLKKLDSYFQEAMERNKRKKKGIFG